MIPMWMVIAAAVMVIVVAWVLFLSLSWCFGDADREEIA